MTRTLAASLLLSVLLFSGVAMAQAGAEAGAEAEPNIIFLCCIGPFLLISLGSVSYTHLTLPTKA